MKRTLVSLLLCVSVAGLLLAGCGSTADTPAPTAAATITPFVPEPTPEPVATDTPVPAVPTATMAPTPSPAPTAAPSPAGPAGWPQEVVRLVNAGRAGQGLPDLVFDATLSLAAQRHADDCARMDSCGSTGSDGSDLDARLASVGYSATASDQAWAMGASPQDIVEWWLGMAPPDDWPRRLALSQNYTHVGVGVASTGTIYYFVAVFARP